MTNHFSTKVYAADVTKLKDKALYKTAYQKVTVERQKKTDNLHFQKDKRLSLGAELLLMQGLKPLGIDRKKMNYCYRTNGKPYLVDEPNVYFNLSHSEEIVICAISSQEIGCDVEKISNRDAKVAKRFFTAAEYQKIAEQKTEQARQEMFFRLWTLKESFLKLTGLGMRLPMDSFCIHLDNDKISVSQEFDCRTYYFQEMNIGQNYKCAICGLDSTISDKNSISAEMLDLFL